MLWSDKLLQGKRILITGASSGIGRTCAILCSQLGAELIACGRNRERLDETMTALSGSGHLALAFELSSQEQIESSLAELKGSKPVAGFIHCAGIERTNPLRTISMGDFAAMFLINVASAVEITRLLARPGMFDKNGTSIVLISSVSGTQGEKGKIEYSSTKAALLGLSKALAQELSGKGFRVNTICPAMVQSEMLDRMFESLPETSVQEIRAKHLIGIPEAADIANLAAYLISDLSGHITGTDLKIDSGYSL